MRAPVATTTSFSPISPALPSSPLRTSSHSFAMPLFARCLLLFALLAQVLAASHRARSPINAHNALHIRHLAPKADTPALRPRGSTCRSRSTKPSSTASSSSDSQSSPSSSSNTGSSSSGSYGSRLEKIQSLYAFSGFVYALNVCIRIVKMYGACLNWFSIVGLSLLFIAHERFQKDGIERCTDGYYLRLLWARHRCVILRE